MILEGLINETPAGTQCRSPDPAVLAPATLPRCVPDSSPRPVPPPRNRYSSPRALINQYCYRLPQRTIKIGGLALDSLDIENVGENGEVWEKL